MRLTVLLPELLESLGRKLDAWRGMLAQSPVGRAVRPIADWLKHLGLLSSPSRYVLIIGDEGASLVRFHRQQAVDALFFAADTEDGFEALRRYLAEDPRAPLLVSADVLEQMYREEQLPKVNRWDRRSIVKRRLDIAFPHDRLKAAVSSGSDRNRATSVLFAALPLTPLIETWSGFLESLPNPIVGFCLLPLESEGLAARLSPPVVNEDRRVWRALVSQQATSGFRQIFESDGCLAVTRLTRQPPGALTGASGAQLIERELRSSISYIKRLGYSDLDRLDLVVLANSDICRAVETRDLPVTSLTTLTPRQAGLVLGFGEVGPEDGPFADVLHAQTLAAKKQPEAVLPSEKLRERAMFAALFKTGFVAAATLTLITLLYVGSMLLDAFDSFTTGELLEKAVVAETQALTQLRQKVRGYEIPIEELVSVGRTDEILGKVQIDPHAVLRALAGAVDPSVKVRKIVFTAPAPTPTADKPADAGYDLRLTLQFPLPGLGQADQTALLTRTIKDKLVQAFPGHEVTLVQSPFGAARAQVIEGSAGSNPAAAGGMAPVAEYLIRKKA